MTFKERDLWSNIKSGDFLPVYLIQGSESYLKQNYATLLTERVVPAEAVTFNLHKLNGPDTDITEISECVEALPVMCERSCVLVHDFDFGAVGDADYDAFSRMFKDLPDSCVLVLWQDTTPFPQRNKKQKELRNLIEKAGAVVDLNARTHDDLVHFVMAESKRNGCAIDRYTADSFIGFVGEDMNTLTNELNKVCHYVHGTITEKDFEAVAVPSLETTAFKMVDSLLVGNFDKVFRSLSILFDQRTEPMLILGALISTYVDMYRAKVVQSANARPAVLKTIFPAAYRSDFKLNNALRRSNRFSLPALRKSLEVLSRADTRLKGSSEDSRIVFEQLMVELAEVRRLC